MVVAWALARKARRPVSGEEVAEEGAGAPSKVAMSLRRTAQQCQSSSCCMGCDGRGSETKSLAREPYSSRDKLRGGETAWMLHTAVSIDKEGVDVLWG